MVAGDVCAAAGVDVTRSSERAGWTTEQTILRQGGPYEFEPQRLTHVEVELALKAFDLREWGGCK